MIGHLNICSEYVHCSTYPWASYPPLQDYIDNDDTTFHNKYIKCLVATTIANTIFSQAIGATLYVALKYEFKLCLILDFDNHRCEVFRVPDPHRDDWSTRFGYVHLLRAVSSWTRDWPKTWIELKGERGEGVVITLHALRGHFSLPWRNPLL